MRSTAKKNILILCDWFLPGYLAGGPIQSVATLTQQLGSHVNFRIITTDRDLHADAPYKNIEVDRWTMFAGRVVFYVSPANLHPEFIFQLVKHTPHDILYLNSLYSKLFTIYPLKWRQKGKIKSELILAPRGMLGDGALAIKPLKKKLFLIYARCFGLFKGLKWQSTSAQETTEIKKRIGLTARVYEVSNLPRAAGNSQPLDKERGHLHLCFISRISEKKNLKFAIDVLKEISHIPVIFDVYGPIENEAYWSTCLSASKLLPANVLFGYNGILSPEAIAPTLDRYHALFLPTRNENYGHIIVEALQQGRPVILSDQTPWRNLEAEAVGFDISLNDKERFSQAVIKLAMLDRPDFEKISQHCRAYIHKKLNVDEIKDGYINLFDT